MAILLYYNSHFIFYQLTYLLASVLKKLKGTSRLSFSSTLHLGKHDLFLFVENASELAFGKCNQS